MLIFGIRILFQVLETGTFHCPTCGTACTYQKRQARRWGHLFWIPLLPLGDVGEPFIRCTQCRTDYIIDVLNLPTDAQLAQWLTYGTRAAVASLVKASADPLAATSAAVQLLQQSTDSGYTEHVLDHDMTHLDIDTAAAWLHPLDDVLTDPGKEAILTQGLLIAHAGGTVTREQSQILVRIAQALGMSQATLRGLNYEAAALLRQAD